MSRQLGTVVQRIVDTPRSDLDPSTRPGRPAVSAVWRGPKRETPRRFRRGAREAV